MATVRMSKSFKVVIVDDAKDMFKKRINRAEELPVEFGDRCYQAWIDSGHGVIINEIWKFGGTLAEEWLALENNIMIDSINNTTVKQIAYLSTCQYIPQVQWLRYRVKLPGERHRDLENEFLRLQGDMFALRKRREDFVKDIRSFLDTMPTLNRALQVFPALKELIHPSDLEQVTPAKRAYHAHPYVRAKVERMTGEIVQAKMLYYEIGLKMYERARSKKEGKTLDRRTKLRKVDKDLELLIDHHRIALIHKDDTATLFFPRLRRGNFYRKWLGVYDLYHPSKKKLAVIARRHLWRGEGWRKTAVPAINGLKICLRTGEFINPSPWPERIQTDKSGPWRSKVTKFRRTLKIMAKMGAFNHIPQQVWSEGDDMWADKYPPLTPMELHYLIYKQEPQKLVRRLVETMRGYGRHSAATNQIRMEYFVQQHFAIYYVHMRDEVRKIEGCYKEKTPHTQDRAVPSAA